MRLLAYLHQSATMTITRYTSRQFDQNTSQAKKAALTGPVFITDRGRPAHVLLTYDEYKKLAGARSRIADLLVLPGSRRVELEIPSLRELAQAADLGEN